MAGYSTRKETPQLVQALHPARVTRLVPPRAPENDVGLPVESATSSAEALRLWGGLPPGGTNNRRRRLKQLLRRVTTSRRQLPTLTA